MAYKHRMSNFELLRILAMILIMFGHFHLRICPLQTYLDTTMSCISALGVDIFIAISGWFGIRFSKEGLSRYIFQVLFILWTVYGLAIVFGLADYNVAGTKISLSFYEGYWFVLGYLGLYLISPVLNSFVEHSSKRDFRVVLLSYYLFQSYYSWLSAWYNYYDGYSIILFSGIYLTAAYLRKYPIAFLQKHSVILLFVAILVMTTIAYLSLWKFGHAARQIRDDNPLVIFASILLLLSFSKLKFQSRVINWLATSCFAVYLIHYSPFVYPYIMQFMHSAYVQFDGLLYIVVLAVSLLAIYLACTLYDQMRILAWKAVLLLKKTTRE